MLRSNVNITWLPRLFINAGGHPIVVGFCEGRWFLQNDPIIELTVDSTCMYLLPLMQEGYGGSFNFAKHLVSDRLREVGLPNYHVETFPFIVPVRTAVSFGAVYWVACAMKWVKDIEFDEEFARELLKVSRTKSVSQNTRNAARRRVKVWEQVNNICLLRLH